MEDVDEETVKFLHHHLKIWVLGEAQWFLGFGRGFGGGRPFLEPAFLLENSGPSVYGALIRSERFYWSLRG